MTGDQNDFLARLKAVLPPRWFGDSTPLLDALLDGLAAAWTWLYGLLAFTIAQTRVGTAAGLWLDLIGNDFFGARLCRRAGEPDTALRGRIQRELVRERGTRHAITSVLFDLTGLAPTVFEPARPADTGVWGTALGYGAAGGWGSLALPFQCFVTAHRPRPSGIAQVAGWGDGAGGYGQGALEYLSLAMSEGQITDADINSAVASVMPVASIAWMRIIN